MYVEGDVPTVVNTGRNDNGCFGGDWAWWIVILLLFGLGGNGMWGGGAGMQGALTRGDLSMDMNFNDLQNAARGIQNGICDSTFALNNTVANGFANAQQAMCQGFGGVNQAIMASGYETRGAISDLGYRMQQCCCDTQRSIDALNYGMAMQACDIKQAMNMNAREIIDGQRAGMDAILGFMTQEKINALQTENTALKFAASQTAQNQFITQVGSDIVNRLSPPAVPAYPVFAPNQSFAYPSGVTFGVRSQSGCSGCAA